MLLFQHAISQPFSKMAAKYIVEALSWKPLLLLLAALLWGLSDPRIAELREMPRSFSIKLHSETQVSDRQGMSGGRFPRHAQIPLSGERRKKLSITHHALSPHPHIVICTPFISSIELQRFYRITMSICTEKWRKAYIY